jgi:uncharacterized protein (UPF0333 family)
MSIDLNNVILLAIAILTAFTTIMTYFTRSDMKKVEIATNSMKDALVKSTAEASYAAGEKVEREKGEQKAALLAAENIATKEK